MKVSLSWLKTYIQPASDIDSLASQLTMAGLEIDAILNHYDYLQTVRTGKIISITPHPNADHLSCCSVDIGEALLTIVCGAPNISTNAIVPVALPETELPDGITIKPGVIRGEKSEAMLCSENELGLGEDRSGVFILPDNTPIGVSLIQALNLNDPVLEIGLTPNRSDCLSIIGIAREVAAIENQTIDYPHISIEDNLDQAQSIDTYSSVTIESPDHCPRYAARLMTHVTVGPSPLWLKNRLKSIGLRSINNVVDITNFVMMEMGQPLHAFDFDQLEENRIVVKLASDDDIFITLDQQKRQLTRDTLMICDGKKPVAIAGVMGGLNSEITNTTTRVLLESAYFTPTSIRKTARRLGLSTDASYRFERGVDPENTVNAMNRAAQLMHENCGAVIVNGWIDEFPKPIIQPNIELSLANTIRLLGRHFTQKEVIQTLQSIECEIVVIDQDKIHVTPPSYRVDIERPEDLMEEVARLTGYDNIPIIPPIAPLLANQPNPFQIFREHFKNSMVGFGFSEIISYSFIHSLSTAHIGLLPDDARFTSIPLINPLSEDQSVMRTSLIPGLMEAVQRNINQQNKHLKLFEVGKVFLSSEQDHLPLEKEMIAGVWTGDRTQQTWYGKQELCDYYDIKGLIESLCQKFHISTMTVKDLSQYLFPYCRPGYAADIMIQNHCIGCLGEVHPNVLHTYDIKQPMFIFELDLSLVYSQLPHRFDVHPLPKFPAINRDMTLILDHHIKTSQIIETIQQCDESLVESIDVVDMYEGEPIEKGKKSVTFRVIYRSNESTLEDDVINTIHTRIAARIVSDFKAGLP